MQKLSKSRLADTIARRRKEQNITQAELANITGINRALISRIEQQDFMPSIEQLENIGDALHFDITELFINSDAEKLHSPSPLNIAVAGTGYVGLSVATLLAQHNHVTAVDIIPEKVELINNKKSPIQDDYIEKYLAEKELDLTATIDGASAYKNAEYVVIATPTNYDSQKNFFDTSAVEAVIELVLKVNPNAIMVIKSTIPVGYTKSVREKYHTSNIIFSPEFLRESKALYDNLYPSRIIVGTDTNDAQLAEAAHNFAALLQEGALKENIDTLFMGFTEAEAVKLFANTYLALRVSYFNELDTYAEMKGLNTKDIISTADAFRNGFYTFFLQIVILPLPYKFYPLLLDKLHTRDACAPSRSRDHRSRSYRGSCCSSPRSSRRSSRTSPSTSGTSDGNRCSCLRISARCPCQRTDRARCPA